MAFTTTITPAKIAIALGVGAPAPDSPTALQWDMWIGDALMLIQARADELAITEIDQARLDFVIREAVVAQIRRPDTATQVTVTVDDGSTSKTYQDSKGRVDILDEWWTLLGLIPDGGHAFNIDTVNGELTTHQPWCSLAFGAVYCSCGGDLAGAPLWEY